MLLIFCLWFKFFADLPLNCKITRVPILIFLVNVGKTFNDGEVSRNHFRLKHFKINDVKLKACHSVAPETVSNSVLIHEDNVVTLDLEQICDNQDYAEDDGSDSISVAGDNEECHNFFMMSYCDFLNRLINVHFIPVSTVKIIAEQYLHLCKQSTTARTDTLKVALKEHLDINEVTMERILSDIDKDPFIEAHESLSSHYKVNSYLDENFKMVRPI